jgi:CheY-like chemotaxis protein
MAKPSVLVVEDNPMSRATAIAMFETLGFTVFDAYDGHHALALLEARPEISLLFSRRDQVRVPLPQAKLLLRPGPLARAWARMAGRSARRPVQRTAAGFIAVQSSWLPEPLRRPARALRVPHCHAAQSRRRTASRTSASANNAGMSQKPQVINSVAGGFFAYRIS